MLAGTEGAGLLLLGGTRINNVSEGEGVTYAWVQRLGRYSANADCHTILHDDLVDLCVALEMEVRMNRAGGVDVCMS